MKRIFIGITIALITITMLPTGIVHAGEAYSSSGSTGSLPLCLPGIYLNQPGDCLPMGPSQTLSSLAKIGYTFPPKSPVGFNPSADLATIPYHYIKVTADKKANSAFPHTS